MTNLKRWALIGAVAIASALGVPAAAGSAAPGSTTVKDMDLSKSFATRSPWRLTATQGPPIAWDATASGADELGELHPCLHRAASSACDPALRVTLRAGVGDDYFSTPHYLNQAQVVHGSGRPQLLVRTASLHAADSGQIVLTQLLAYRPGRDRFVRVYEHATGTNNNQEDRFIETGRLKGDVISAEPTQNAPYGFWITLNAPTAAGPYKQVLRYRSATHYNDGNRLAAIDSEMPTILQHLGLWRPGMPLPRPAGPCPKPHMVGKEMWCE